MAKKGYGTGMMMINVRSGHEAGFAIGQSNLMETLIHHTLTYVSSLHNGQIPTRQCMSI